MGYSFCSVRIVSSSWKALAGVWGCGMLCLLLPRPPPGNKQVFSSHSPSHFLPASKLMPCLPRVWPAVSCRKTIGIVSRIPSRWRSLRLQWMEEARGHRIACGTQWLRSSLHGPLWEPGRQWTGPRIAMKRCYRQWVPLCWTRQPWPLLAPWAGFSWPPWRWVWIMPYVMQCRCAMCRDVWKN